MFNSNQHIHNTITTSITQLFLNNVPCEGRAANEPANWTQCTQTRPVSTAQNPIIKENFQHVLLTDIRSQYNKLKVSHSFFKIHTYMYILQGRSLVSVLTMLDHSSRCWKYLHILPHTKLLWPYFYCFLIFLIFFCFFSFLHFFGCFFFF